MKTRTVVLLVILILVAVIAIQNSALRDFKLFFWAIYAPMFVLILVFFCIGFFAGFLAGRSRRKKEVKEPPQPVEAAQAERKDK